MFLMTQTVTYYVTLIPNKECAVYSCKQKNCEKQSHDKERNYFDRIHPLSYGECSSGHSSSAVTIPSSLQTVGATLPLPHCHQHVSPVLLRLLFSQYLSLFDWICEFPQYIILKCLPPKTFPKASSTPRNHFDSITYIKIN